jgi:uncharacterized repeat protein (TIGR03806 family)
MKFTIHSLGASISLLSLISICILLSGVRTRAAESDHATIHWNGKFEKSISPYNLFQDAIAQRPNGGLFFFDINTPLFSDYAVKDRFVYLPDGTAMTYREDGPFELPVGAAIVKSFSYPIDFRDPAKGRRLIETRLLINTPSGWQGAAYVWNEDCTDAKLKVAGAVVPVEWIDARGVSRSTDYLVPNMNQCKYCHRGFGQTAPLGLTARQLNRTVASSNEKHNQLDHWSAMGILRDAPNSSDVSRLAVWDDPGTGTVEQRALTYLDVNCAHCHNPAGLAGPTLLGFTLDDALVNRPGVYHRPTAAGNASRGRNFAIVPGNPDASFLLTRLSSTHAFIRMPQIGRTVVHDEGVALIREWILSLADDRVPSQSID